MYPTILEAVFNSKRAINRANAVKEKCKDKIGTINGEKFTYKLELDLVEAV